MHPHAYWRPPRRQRTISAMNSRRITPPISHATVGGFLPSLAIKLAVAVLIVLPFVSFVAMFAIYLERKVAGHIQSRRGPMRVGGWHGWLQSVADGMKLLSKEDLAPAGADGALFRLAPYLAFAPVFAAFLALPWSRDLSGLTRHFGVGVFFILAMLGLEVLGVILAGWSSNNKWAIYGAMREACQMVSYEIPLGMSIVCCVLVAGSLNLYAIARVQHSGITAWLAFHDPFNFAAFFVYYIAALASCKRAPFDLPESESELVAGYHTEYSGLRFSIFFFAEYAAMFVVSAIQTTLWLGAWYDPFGIVRGLENASRGPQGVISLPLAIVANGAGLAVFLLKTAGLMYSQMWIRWTLPRLRIDQVLYLCMKVLLPLAFINLLGAATYAWLVDAHRLPVVQRVVEIGLAVAGCGIVLTVVSMAAWACLTARGRTFKTLYPSTTVFRDLPGA